MSHMKHRHRGKVAAAPRGPREIHVRLTAPHLPSQAPEVWVVNGRVIRFLDPSRPDVDAVRPRLPHRRFGLLRALAHR
jgi:hypothetical protein